MRLDRGSGQPACPPLVSRPVNAPLPARMSARTIDPQPVDGAPAEPASVPFRMVLLSIGGLWAAYFLLFTARSWLVGLDFQAELFWRRLAVTGAGMAATLVLWLVLRLFDGRKLRAQLVAALVLAVPTALLIAQTNHLIFAPMQSKLESQLAADRGFSVRRDAAGNLVIEGSAGTGQAGQGALSSAGPAPPPPAASVPARGRVVLPGETTRDQWLRLVELALSQYFLLLAWSALYLALLAGARAQAFERRAGEFRRAAKAAELRSLRYQVNLHFLFNTLNSLSALVLTGRSADAERMIGNLSRFYRRGLADDPTADVPLADEFAMQQLYLEIEAVRFPSRLRTAFLLPPELAQVPVPGMILQPLVENSVKYAVAPSTRPVTIAVSAALEGGGSAVGGLEVGEPAVGDVLLLVVSDDGAPAAGCARADGLGIGLANVSDRLLARFGPGASVAGGPVPGGYRTELRLPLGERWNAKSDGA